MSLEISAETSFALDLTNAQQYGPELHTNANAASDPNGNEADATTGWASVGLTGTGANVFESQSSVANVGAYAIHADCTDTPTSLARFYLSLLDAPFNLSDGDVVKLSFDIRHTGTGSITGGWSAWLANANAASDHILTTITSSDTTWQSVETTFTYDSTYRFLTFREANSQNDGGIYLDNLSVKKVL